jgi:hypothetical protein
MHGSSCSLQGHIEGCWLGCFFRAEEERGVRSYLYKSVTVEPDLQTDLQRVEGKMRFVVSGTRPLEPYWEDEAGPFSHRGSNG